MCMISEVFLHDNASFSVSLKVIQTQTPICSRQKSLEMHLFSPGHKVKSKKANVVYNSGANSHMCHPKIKYSQNRNCISVVWV
jgi:hypothetical protein